MATTQSLPHPFFDQRVGSTAVITNLDGPCVGLSEGLADFIVTVRETTSKSIVIIVDIFRASTTMVTALGHGARSIIPVSTTEEAETLGRTLGCLIAAERNVQRCPFAQLGNDPAEYTEELVSGKDIVFTTTNGTRALNIAKEHGVEEILVGAFINLRSTLHYCHQLGKDILVLAAGWKGQMALEDTLYAGALAALAEGEQIGSAADDV